MLYLMHTAYNSTKVGKDCVNLDDKPKVFSDISNRFPSYSQSEVGEVSLKKLLTERYTVPDFISKQMRRSQPFIVRLVRIGFSADINKVANHYL